MLKNKRVFITGGAGFIGSTLARLLEADNEICLYDSLRRDARAHTLKDASDNVTLVQGDVRDFEKVKDALDNFKPTHVVHAAAIAGIDTVGKRPADTLLINSIGSANVLRAAQEHGDIERVVCFSTSEIFGANADHVSEKSDAIVGPVGEARWVYAVSKLYTEHLAFAYYKQFGLPTACVRPFNVYGPGQVGEGALSTFTQRALKNETIQIRGDGEQIRAWCFVDDMVDGVMRCLEHPGAVGKTFNIGHKESAISIKDLAAKIIKLLGSDSKIEFVEGMSADVYVRVPDVEYPKNEIGFEAKVGLDEGLLRGAEYYREKLGLA